MSFDFYTMNFYNNSMKDLEYSVIFSDDDIVVLNKRSGYLVAADRYDLESPRLDERASKEFGELFAVHRIDTDASGIVVYARNIEIQKILAAQFQENKVEKIYHCLVNGHPLWQDLHVDLKLLPDSDQRHRTSVNQKIGKSAATDYKLLGTCGPYAWVEAIPRTDRAHQIRVHLKENGVNIVCDPLYSGNQKPVRLSELKKRWNGDELEERPLLSRLALHAYSLAFAHPKSGEKVTYCAPYQKDMDAVRKQLAKIFKLDPLE